MKKDFKGCELPDGRKFWIDFKKGGSVVKYSDGTKRPATDIEDILWRVVLGSYFLFRLEHPEGIKELPIEKRDELIAKTIRRL